MPYKSTEAQRTYSREYARRRRAADPQYLNDYQNRWAKANRAKVSAKYKRWRETNPNAKRREWERDGLPMPTRPMPALCECCGKPPSGRASLHLDHCHETGVFRGWLCQKCNMGIGQLGDTIDSLKKALEYLNGHTLTKSLADESLA